MTTADYAETFTTHPWRIKTQDAQHVLGVYTGQTAVIEITQTLSFVVHSGTAKHVCPRQAAVPSQWGNYRLRSKIHGIDIMVRLCKHFLDRRHVRLYQIRRYTAHTDMLHPSLKALKQTL